MKKLLPILLCATAFAAAPDTTPRQARAAFEQLLKDQCPQKHLELLAPADLLNTIEDYELTLNAEEMALVHKYQYRACHNVAAGATCDNTGFLQAAIKLNRLDHFTAKLCTQPILCTEQSKCSMP
ncbi:hypothetical protein [Terriglobus tenax]|uniref:hypothetical protein n=1 Tax=Terriglobus tenax TaxID=1111115 RepID=UPI0021DFBCDC|nr:hypothetical protein [Terriglobus tenax]